MHAIVPDIHGDFIDGGKFNEQVITDVRNMVANGSAHAIMGNHELNAILFNESNQERTGWLRNRSDDNRRQHGTFIAEYGCMGELATDSPEEHRLIDVLDWFRSLPLFLEFNDFRVVHAQWDAASIALISELDAFSINNSIKGARLRKADYESVADIQSVIGAAVERSLKGTEAALPDGYSFLDHHKKPRKHVRLKWWTTGTRSYRNLALSVKDPQALPDELIHGLSELAPYGAAEKPVFFRPLQNAGNANH
jgi:hypothetical protein